MILYACGDDASNIPLLFIWSMSPSKYLITSIPLLSQYQQSTLILNRPDNNLNQIILFITNGEKSNLRKTVDS